MERVGFYVGRGFQWVGGIIGVLGMIAAVVAIYALISYMVAGVLGWEDTKEWINAGLGPISTAAFLTFGTVGATLFGIGMGIEAVTEND